MHREWRDVSDLPADLRPLVGGRERVQVLVDDDGDVHLPPKLTQTAHRIADHAAAVAMEDADAEGVEAVESEMDTPSHRGLRGAARAAKVRALAKSRAPNDRAAAAIERAVERREEARQRRGQHKATRARWEGHSLRQAQARRRDQAIRIARRWHEVGGGYREHRPESDGRKKVIRKIAGHEAWPREDRVAALADLYGQAVADAYDSDGVDAAVAALPEVW